MRDEKFRNRCNLAMHLIGAADNHWWGDATQYAPPTMAYMVLQLQRRNNVKARRPLEASHKVLHSQSEAGPLSDLPRYEVGSKGQVGAATVVQRYRGLIGRLATHLTISVGKGEPSIYSGLCADHAE